VIIVKLNGEIEEKLKTIALLKGVEKEELLDALREKAAEAVRIEVEKKYREVVASH